MTEAAVVAPGRVARRGPMPSALAGAAALVALAVVAALVLTGRLPGAGTCGPLDGSACQRILFLGNSYTDVNDLPHVFAELAMSGGQHVGTGKVAPGGEELSGHATSAETRQALDSAHWDVVVLQEQSEVPAIAQMRNQRMAPAARTLAAQVRAIGARPILLETWAHRDGWPQNGLPDYGWMQNAIEAGYLTVATDIGAPVAPAGAAWRSVRAAAPQIQLWQSDGSHPTVAGTYLAACVLYATIFRRSPVGLGYDAGLGADLAATLQAAAAQTVLSDPGRWGSQ